MEKSLRTSIVQHLKPKQHECVLFNSNAGCIPMPIPFIITTIFLGTGITGAVKAIEGLDDISTAKSIGRNAESRYDSHKNAYEKSERKTTKRIEKLGRARIKASANELNDFIHQFRRLSGANQSALKELTRAGFDIGTLQKMENISVGASKVVGTGVKAISSSVATYYGALGLTTTLATASTGTAIANLSGAAASRAALAWWGGGSIATGGGGMALGGLTLGVVTIGPALAIGGFMLASEGKKALKKAKKYRAKVDEACETFGLAIQALDGINHRCGEIKNVIEQLASRLRIETQKLKSIKNLKKDSAKKSFHQAALIAKALADVLTVQVIDENGGLTASSKTALNNAKRRL